MPCAFAAVPEQSFFTDTCVTPLFLAGFDAASGMLPSELKILAFVSNSIYSVKVPGSMRVRCPALVSC